MNLVSVLDGLKTALGTIDGLRVTDTFEGRVNVPQAIIWPGLLRYHVTYGDSGLDRLDARIRVLVSHGSTPAGWDLLNGYAARSGAASILAAVESDPTLSGVCDTVSVAEYADLGEYTVGQVSYLGGEWTLDVVG